MLKNFGNNVAHQFRNTSHYQYLTSPILSQTRGGNCYGTDNACPTTSTCMTTAIATAGGDAMRINQRVGLCQLGRSGEIWDNTARHHQTLWVVDKATPWFRQQRQQQQEQREWHPSQQLPTLAERCKILGISSVNEATQMQFIAMQKPIREAQKQRMDPQRFKHISPEFLQLLWRHDNFCIQQNPFYGLPIPKIVPTRGRRANSRLSRSSDLKTRNTATTTCDSLSKKICTFSSCLSSHKSGGRSNRSSSKLRDNSGTPRQTTSCGTSRSKQRDRSKSPYAKSGTNAVSRGGSKCEMLSCMCPTDRDKEIACELPAKKAHRNRSDPHIGSYKRADNAERLAAAQCHCSRKDRHALEKELRGALKPAGFFRHARSAPRDPSKKKTVDANVSKVHSVNFHRHPAKYTMDPPPKKSRSPSYSSASNKDSFSGLHRHPMGHMKGVDRHEAKRLRKQEKELLRKQRSRTTDMSSLSQSSGFHRRVYPDSVKQVKKSRRGGSINRNYDYGGSTTKKAQLTSLAGGYFRHTYHPRSPIVRSRSRSCCRSRSRSKSPQKHDNEDNCVRRMTPECKELLAKHSVREIWRKPKTVDLGRSQSRGSFNGSKSSKKQSSDSCTCLSRRKTPSVTFGKKGKVKNSGRTDPRPHGYSDDFHTTMQWRIRQKNRSSKNKNSDCKPNIRGRSEDDKNHDSKFSKGCNAGRYLGRTDSESEHHAKNAHKGDAADYQYEKRTVKGVKLNKKGSSSSCTKRLSRSCLSRKRRDDSDDEYEKRSVTIGKVGKGGNGSNYDGRRRDAAKSRKQTTSNSDYDSDGSHGSHGSHDGVSKEDKKKSGGLGGKDQSGEKIRKSKCAALFASMCRRRKSEPPPHRKPARPVCKNLGNLKASSSLDECFNKMSLEELEALAEKWRSRTASTAPLQPLQPKKIGGAYIRDIAAPKPKRLRKTKSGSSCRSICDTSSGAIADGEMDKSSAAGLPQRRRKSPLLVGAPARHRICHKDSSNWVNTTKNYPQHFRAIGMAQRGDRVIDRLHKRNINRLICEEQLVDSEELRKRAHRHDLCGRNSRSRAEIDMLRRHRVKTQRIIACGYAPHREAVESKRAREDARRETKMVVMKRNVKVHCPMRPEFYGPKRDFSRDWDALGRHECCVSPMRRLQLFHEQREAAAAVRRADSAISNEYSREPQRRRPYDPGELMLTRELRKEEQLRCKRRGDCPPSSDSDKENCDRRRAAELRMKHKRKCYDSDDEPKAWRNVRPEVPYISCPAPPPKPYGGAHKERCRCQKPERSKKPQTPPKHSRKADRDHRWYDEYDAPTVSHCQNDADHNRIAWRLPRAPPPCIPKPEYILGQGRRRV